ncbi:hypothetical protein C7377_1545 [Balneicella halophila]|uniref:Uncharacterized protein n=1 Tax=Balneicella halophila TaxID=1537566 RepID=A0A7L4UNP1_BALHA|nr:hypothetical protein [Balneicella halophila]PVX49907.1 hypothetical protein C7377_1545 [Balneicella halophila]
MGSIRRLKKDINYLTDEIVQHSLLINLLYKDNDDEIKKVIETAMENRNDLIKRVNIRNQSKSEYKQIREDLIAKTDKAFEELSKLTEK